MLLLKNNYVIEGARFKLPQGITMFLGGEKTLPWGHDYFLGKKGLSRSLEKLKLLPKGMIIPLKKRV